jgi:site-specific recombinase XerC
MTKQSNQSVHAWLNDLTIDHSPETIKTYEWHIKHLMKAYPDGEIKDLKREELVQYLADWKRKGVGDSVLKVALNAFRSFYKFTRGNRSPAKTIPVPRPKKRLQRTLTGQQALALLETCDDGTPRGARNVAMVALMLDSGLRASEVCRLRIDRLSLEELKFQVIVKGGDEMEGVFSVETANLLSKWLAYREKYAKANTVFVGFEGHRVGESLTVYGLRTIFRKLGQAAGLMRLSPHDLRRTFATLAHQMGAPTRMVQIAGRWNDILQVEQYTRALRPEDFAPYAPVSRLMNGR